MIKLVVTDLDGTLLTSESELSPENRASLAKLGQKKIIRVIATGRNLYSALNILAPEFPIDYLVFSSGAGIMDWKSKLIIHDQHMDREEVREISSVLYDHNVDFAIHDKIPDNHFFCYCSKNENNNDFFNRVNAYKKFSRPFSMENIGDASQILAVLEDNVLWFEELKSKFQDIKVIRTTSPINGKSIWMEIFPKHISKAFGLKFICELHDVSYDEIVAIGNDYNDLDFLNFCKFSYVVENAPYDLKELFSVVNSNDEHGFAIAVKKFFE